MMTKLTNLSQKYIKAKGQDRQEISMITAMVREIMKINIGQMVEIGEYHSVVEYNMHRIIGTDQGIIRTMEMILEEGILLEIFDQKQNYRGGYRRNYRNDNYERVISRFRGRQYSNNRRNDRSNSRSRSGSRASMNRDRIRCYKCRENNHFAKGFLTSKVERESEEIQQMYSMGENKPH